MATIGEQLEQASSKANGGETRTSGGKRAKASRGLERGERHVPAWRTRGAGAERALRAVEIDERLHLEAVTRRTVQLAHVEWYDLTPAQRENWRLLVERVFRAQADVDRKLVAGGR